MSRPAALKQPDKFRGRFWFDLWGLICYNSIYAEINNLMVMETDVSPNTPA